MSKVEDKIKEEIEKLLEEKEKKEKLLEEKEKKEQDKLSIFKKY